jgi:hypothetical protein
MPAGDTDTYQNWRRLGRGLGSVQAQIDAGEKTGPSSEELEEIKRLRAEVRDKFS